MPGARIFNSYEDFASEHAQEACSGEPEPTRLEWLLRQIHETVLACWFTLCLYILCSTAIGLVVS